MRILLLNDHAPGPGGGVEVHLERLVRGLREAGDEVELVAAEAEHHGIELWRDVWDPAARHLVEERVRTFRPDVVHAHDVARALSTSVLTALGDLPLVLTAHDLRWLGHPDVGGANPRALTERFVKGPLDRAVAHHRVDVTIGVTRHLTELLAEAGWPDPRYVPIPADEPIVDPEPLAEADTVLFVGRLSPEKGVPELLRAWPAIRAAHPDVRLAIAGDGPLRAEVRERLADDERADVLGLLDAKGLSRAYGTARLVVVPAQPTRRPEGASMVTVEAAMHGRPAVVSDDPAVREVAAGVGGAVVVPTGPDFVRDLARAVSDLLADELELAGRGAAAAAGVRTRHDLTRVVRDVRAIYRDVVDSGRA